MVSGVRYCRSGAGRIAYSVTGAGPVLLLDPGWVTHLRAQMAVEPFAAFVTELSRHFAVVRFDKPGCGLSERTTTGTRTVDEQVSAVVAVADAVRADRFSMFGASQGGHVAIATAALHPDRVDAIALFGTCADGADLAPASVRESLLGLVRAHWGLGSRLLSDIFAPDATAAEVESLARLQRACASADTARDLLAMHYATDVSALLPRVRARTVVVHREQDAATAFELGRRVAAGIPGAVLVPLQGRAHLFYDGDWRPVLDAVVTGLLPSAPELARLTAREVQIARLVAVGGTNQAIAAELGVAVRTVDAHVGNIRAKLDVRSRAQIAAWITRHDPDGATRG